MTLTLRINPIACTGHGVCAEVAPELIEPDEWGYPIVNAGPVPLWLEREARKAVAMCPVLALKLQPAKLDGPGGTVPPATWHARKKAVTSFRPVSMRCSHSPWTAAGEAAVRFGRLQARDRERSLGNLQVRSVIGACDGVFAVRLFPQRNVSA